MSLYKRFTSQMQFEINKHGSYGGAETLEEAVNRLTPHEFLERLSEALEEAKTDMRNHK